MLLSLSSLISTLGLSSVAQAAPRVSPRYDGGLSALCNPSALQIPSTLGNLKILSVVTQLYQNYTYDFSTNPAIQAAIGAALPNMKPLNFCNVTVTYTHPGWNDTVNVNNYLPLEWNGRYLANGGGGFVAGSPLTSILSMLLGQTQAWVQSNTDAGHAADPSPADPWPITSSGNINYPLLVNFASESLHDMAVVTKVVIKAFYKKPQDYAYFYGGSTGGRQGHMLAQRWPEDFNGIVGYYPAVYWNNLMASLAWPVFVMDQAKYYPPPCELQTITFAAVAACDGEDGVKDGIISHPALCKFNPDTLVGQPAAVCYGTTRTVSSAAVEIMKRIWEGPRSSKGRFQWYGYNPGTDVALPGGIAYNLCDKQGNNCMSQGYSLPQDWFRYFVRKNEKWSLLNITHEEWDDVFNDATGQLDSIIGTNNPDLSQLRKAGTKLMSWHGTDDPLIPANGTYHYYDQVLERHPDARDFYRLFIAPGAVHGYSEGITPPYGSALAQMVQWVEKGVAPETLIGSGLDENNKLMQRDLCMYPRQQHYTGGNHTQAASYICV